MTRLERSETALAALALVAGLGLGWMLGRRMSGMRENPAVIEAAPSETPEPEPEPFGPHVWPQPTPEPESEWLPEWWKAPRRMRPELQNRLYERELREA